MYNFFGKKKIDNLAIKSSIYKKIEISKYNRTVSIGLNFIHFVCIKFNKKN